MKILWVLALSVATVVVSYGQGVKLDGLFLTMEYRGGGYTPTYYWFLADGRALGVAPAGGLTAADFQAGCQSQPASCGRFTQAGEQVSITMNGTTRTVKVNAAPGGYQVNGLATIRAEPMPPGTKLNGRYSGNGPRVAVSTGSGNSVASAHSYEFKPDGTFSRESVGSVRTSASSATSVNAAGGKYKVSGNTLELSENGQTVRHLIFVPYDGALVIDGVICSLRK